MAGETVRVIADKEDIVAIADAVRLKTGGTAKLTLDEMATTIEGIETGGSEIETRTIEFGVEDGIGDITYAMGTRYIDNTFKTFVILPSNEDTLPNNGTSDVVPISVDIDYYYVSEEGGYFFEIPNVVCGSIMTVHDKWEMGYGAINDSKWKFCISNYNDGLMQFRIPFLSEYDRLLSF